MQDEKKRPTDNMQNDNLWKGFYMKPQAECVDFKHMINPSMTRRETKGTHNGGLGL